MSPAEIEAFLIRMHGQEEGAAIFAQGEQARLIEQARQADELETRIRIPEHVDRESRQLTEWLMSHFDTHFPQNEHISPLRQPVFNHHDGYVLGGHFIHDGSLYMFGVGSNGRLGNGTVHGSRTPVRVIDNVFQVLDAVPRTISVGDRREHSDTVTILTRTGYVYTWGTNRSGEVGDGTMQPRLTPFRVLEEIVAIAEWGNWGLRLALGADGILWVWGNGLNTPVPILDDVTHIHANRFGDSPVTILRSDNSLWSFGRDFRDQLRLDSLSPQMVIGDFRTPNSGDYLIADDGTRLFRHFGSFFVSRVDNVLPSYQAAYLSPLPSEWDAWDSRQHWMWIGDFADSLFSPGLLSENRQIVSSLLTEQHLRGFRLLDNNTLWVWGVNDHGSLGLGDAQGASTPLVLFDNVFSYVGNTVLTLDGDVYTWGRPFWGNETKFYPVHIMDGVVSLANNQGGAAYFALRYDGTLWAWGANMNGHFARNTTERYPEPIMIMENVAYISTQMLMSAFVIKQDGHLWGWGQHSHWVDGNRTIVFDSYLPQLLVRNYVHGDEDWYATLTHAGQAITVPPFAQRLVAD